MSLFLKLILLLFLLTSYPSYASWFSTKIKPKCSFELNDKEKNESDAFAYYATALLVDDSKDNFESQYIGYLSKAIMLFPESVALAELSDYFSMRRNFAGIIPILKPIVKKHPFAPTIHILLALAYQKNKEATKGRQVLENFNLRTNYSIPVAINELSFFYKKDKSYHKIDVIFEKAVKQANSNTAFELYTYIADFYLGLASLDEKYAITSLQKKGWEDKSLFYILASVESLNKDSKLSDIYRCLFILSINKDVVLIGKFLKKCKNLNISFLELNLLQAEIYKNNKQYKLAVSLLKKTLKSKPFVPILWKLLGQNLLKIDKKKDSIKAFEKYILLKPNDTRVATTLAQLYALLGETTKSLNLLKSIKTKSIGDKWKMAMAYQVLNKIPNALNLLKKMEDGILKMNKKIIRDFYFFYAHLYDQANDRTNAIFELKKCLKLIPNNPPLLNFLGYLLAESNQELESAKTMIIKALEYDPYNIAYLDSLAWVYYRLGKDEEALFFIEKALLCPTNFNKVDYIILDHAGDIYYRKNNFVEAVKYWNRSLKIKN